MSINNDPVDDARFASFDALGKELSAIFQSIDADPSRSLPLVSRARLLFRISDWPEEWGNNFLIQVFGSFTLKKAMAFPMLRVTIDGRTALGPSNFGAPWFYSARISVNSRDLPGLLDGIGRLEKALGALHLASIRYNTNRGPGCAIHYRCHLLEDVGHFEEDLTWAEPRSNQIITGIEQCSERVRELLWRAVWWMRHARGDRQSGHQQPALFLIYLSYWNALECIVNAINVEHPVDTLSEEEKEREVRKILLPHGKEITLDLIRQCRTIVDPGQRVRIQHALAYVEKTIDKFDAKSTAEAIYSRAPREERLSQIRNDIDHGSIVEYDLPTRERVLKGLTELSNVVNRMLHASVAGLVKR